MENCFVSRSSGSLSTRSGTPNLSELEHFLVCIFRPSEPPSPCDVGHQYGRSDPSYQSSSFSQVNLRSHRNHSITGFSPDLLWYLYQWTFKQKFGNSEDWKWGSSSAWMGKTKFSPSSLLQWYSLRNKGWRRGSPTWTSWRCPTDQMLDYDHLCQIHLMELKELRAYLRRETF